MKALSFSLVLLSPAAASAHPGHGTSPGDTILHHLSEPVHAAFLLAVIAVALGVGAPLLARARRRS